MPALGFMFYILMTVFGLAQLFVGYIGIEEHLGTFWAWSALAAVFFLRFTLPITIGTFFGAMDVLGWHWALALIFTAPGLIFVVPGMIVTLFDWFNGRQEQP